ncbi:MAG: apolipoprotein N-acyltransferase [bacterium]|nr:apolipoprotein N-acyltransferase [bacterium]
MMNLKNFKISRENIRTYGIALISGIILSFSFPPYPLGFIAYFSLIPVMYWIRTGSLSFQFRLGYVWGFGFQTALLFWIFNSDVGGALMTCFFVPVYTGLFFLICRFLFLRFGMLFFFIFPFIWTSIEYLRSVGVLGFIWMSLAYTQTYYLPFIQFADITGMFGVTFLICVINVTVYFIIEKVRNVRKDGLQPGTAFSKLSPLCILLSALMIIPVLYGRNKGDLGTDRSNTVKVSLIQGHIDMDQKIDAKFKDNNFRIYQDITEKATAEYDPDLVVWPETATATWMRNQTKYLGLMRRIMRNANTPFLIGSPDFELIRSEDENYYKQYNSAVYYSDHRSKGEWYAKIFLVPFGEWFPYEDKFRILQNLDFGQGNFTPGNEYRIFTLSPGNTELNDTENVQENSLEEPVRFSAAICYESIFPGFIREFCKLGSQMIIVISNDNWFGRTSALHQHSQYAVYRAIENRIGIANCSNSGISSIIDPYGRVTDESNIWEREYLNGELFYRNNDDDVTFYTEYGEVFSQLFILISAGSIVTGILIKNKKIRETV